MAHGVKSFDPLRYALCDFSFHLALSPLRFATEEKKAMIRTNLFSCLILFTALSLLNNCGSSPEVSATASTITITAREMPSETPVFGIHADIILPAGATVKASQHPPEIDSGIIETSDPNSIYCIGTYSPANNVVSLYLMKATSIQNGDFIKVKYEIANGAFPSAGDFSVANLKTYDMNGAVITGLSSTVSIN